MITTILFVCLVLGILLTMKFPLVRIDENRPPNFKSQPSAKTHEKAAGNSGQPAFECFCRNECRYRHVCFRKQAALHRESCYEFELHSNALW